MPPMPKRTEYAASDEMGTLVGRMQMDDAAADMDAMRPVDARNLATLCAAPGCGGRALAAEGEASVGGGGVLSVKKSGGAGR